MTEQVRILGCVNDSQLPGVYKAADLFVLPSEYDSCPLVVPEAIFSGLPVLLSDAVIGRLEMIDPGNSGYSYHCGDTDALAVLLRQILGDPALLHHMREAVARQMGAGLRLICWTLRLAQLRLHIGANMRREEEGERIRTLLR